MLMVNVVTIAANIDSGWSAWCKGRWPPGAVCYIRRMNQVNSYSGCAVIIAPWNIGVVIIIITIFSCPW